MIFGCLFRLKKCCGCMSLKTGSLMIGYIELLGNGYGLGTALYNNEGYDEIIDYLLISISLLLISVVMLWGVHKEQRKPIFPWLLSKFLAYFAFTIIYGFKVVESVYLLRDLEDKKYRMMTMILVGAFTLLILLAWYTFFCVYSFYSSIIKVEDETDKEKED